jgi:NAD(P)-dependent dehydrogenase (short-subunit alcohol dehydrogenase family)
MLEGKTALVTGAANGIGRATVARFEAEGARVIAVDRVPGDGSRDAVLWAQADVTDVEAMAAAVELLGDHASLDVCVANAGVARIEDFLDGSPSSWLEVLEVNLLGVMVTLQAAARRMVAGAGGGRLLATASIAGLRGEPHDTAYCASKGGVIALMKTLAVELAPYGITANAVAPGMIATDLSTGCTEALSREEGIARDDFEAAFLAAHVPAKRIGSPEEVAGLFCYLASPDASFVTGSVLRIDGGEAIV